MSSPWASAEFALRGALPRLDRLFASWRTSVVLMVLAGLYYGMLAVWARSSAVVMVQRIAGMLPFWALYALLLVSTAWCLWRRVPALVRDVGAEPLASRGRAAFEISVPKLTAGEAARLLRRLGYRGVAQPDGSLRGGRQRWAALGTYLFHGSFFVVAAGFLATMGAREEWRVWVAAGEEYTASVEQVLSGPAGAALGVRPPSAPFSLVRLTPEFWRDQLLFTTLTAELSMNGEVRATGINRPLWLGFADFLRLSGFGYAPRYEVLDRSGRVLESAVVKMNVFPPGQRDYFRLRLFPHRVYVQVYPDLAVEGGEPYSKSMNLAKPAVRVRVYRGKVDLGEALLPLGEPYAFEGLVLRFPEIRYWGELSLLHDPGAPVVLFGFALGLLGLLVKLRGPRSELSWSPSASGGGTLRGYGGAAQPAPEQLGEGRPS